MSILILCCGIVIRFSYIVLNGWGFFFNYSVSTFYGFFYFYSYVGGGFGRIDIVIVFIYRRGYISALWGF